MFALILALLMAPTADSAYDHAVDAEHPLDLRMNACYRWDNAPEATREFLDRRSDSSPSVQYIPTPTLVGDEKPGVYCVDSSQYNHAADDDTLLVYPTEAGVGVLLRTYRGK